MIQLAERGLLPDWLIRWGIRRLLKTRLRQEERRNVADFIADGPVAVATDKANEQHYEVPAEFFETILGPRLKYSCCLFGSAKDSLAQAEAAMLWLTCERAEIENGMEVLDLGCGWGSFTLWLAENHPRCRITAISNSHGQRRFIEDRCRARGVHNVRVLTRDVNVLEKPGDFDRIVSIEMLEHVRNHPALFQRLSRWLRPGGKVFAHVFCHRRFTYPFEAEGSADWMARHFFSGGMMPSFDLFRSYDRHLHVERQWQVDGRHYAATCEAWLRNLDANREPLLHLFAKTSSAPGAKITLQRWRIFLMACAELFGFRQGTEWFVGHYLLAPRVVGSQAKEDNRRPEAVRMASGIP